MTPEGKPLFFVHDFGECPIDFTRGVEEALTDFAADVDMSIEEISGVSIAPTLGQAEKASAGSASRRGGLIRKLETFAGEVVRDIGQLAKRFYTDEKVTELMGPAFTTRKPLLDDNGQRDIDPKTKVYRAVPMPRKFFVEMVMDRIAACKIYHGSAYTDADALNYLVHAEEVRDGSMMHPDTRRELLYVLTMLRDRGEKETFRFLREVVLAGKPFAVPAQ